MDWIIIIKYIAIGFFISLFMSYSNKASSKSVDQGEDGKFVLRMNKGYQIIGLIGVGIVVIFVIAAIAVNEKELFFISFLMFLLFGGLGGMILLYYYNHSVEFDAEYMKVTDLFGKSKTMKWAEVEDLKFNPIWGYIYINSNAEKLRLSHHLVGMIEFVKIMEQSTTFRAKELKLPFG